MGSGSHVGRPPQARCGSAWRCSPTHGTRGPVRHPEGGQESLPIFRVRAVMRPRVFAGASAWRRKAGSAAPRLPARQSQSIPPPFHDQAQLPARELPKPQVCGVPPSTCPGDADHPGKAAGSWPRESLPRLSRFHPTSGPWQPTAKGKSALRWPIRNSPHCGQHEMVPVIRPRAQLHSKTTMTNRTDHAPQRFMSAGGLTCRGDPTVELLPVVLDPGFDVALDGLK